MTSAYWHTLVAAAYDRADQHRPSDRAGMRAAALELRQRGLTARDIASVLRMSEAAVRALIQPNRCDMANPGTTDNEVSPR